jgi:hypothetical protein
MFGRDWTQCLAGLDALGSMPRSPRAAVKTLARAFFDFAAADLARHQLMNQRTIPGFVPSAEAYAPAVEVLERARQISPRAGCIGLTISICTPRWSAGCSTTSRPTTPAGTGGHGYSTKPWTCSPITPDYPDPEGVPHDPDQCARRPADQAEDPHP